MQTPTSIDPADKAAAAIDSAASSLRSKADSLPGGEKVARAAHTTAAAMEKAAGYVRDRDIRALASDIQHTVKRHPGATLLTATAVGFLLARVFMRR